MTQFVKRVQRSLKSVSREAKRRAYLRRGSFPPIEDSILLAGSPRSGTTWLGDVLGATPKHLRLTEPLHLSTPGLTEAGFSWRTAVEPEDEWLEGAELLSEVFSGPRISAGMVADNDWPQLLFSDRAIIKAVRANRMLPWLHRCFPFKGIIYLVRHPCGVISSQMAHPLFPSVGKAPDYDFLFVDRYLPHLSEYARGLRSEEAVRALTWALDQYMPLSYAEATWFTLSYENIILAGESELTQLYAWLGLPLPAHILGRLHKRSREAHSWSANHEAASAEERINSWRQRLTSEQANRIFRVIERVGSSGFGPNLFKEFLRS